ncbi:RadC family protein [Rickettsiales bacterium LUAb2]
MDDHLGHRNRLKNKFLQNDNTLLDYELLELLLFYAIPRKDVKPLAKILLNHFGSIQKVLTASPDELNQILKNNNNNINILFKLAHKLCKEILKKELINKPVIANWQQLTNYCFTNLAYYKEEKVHIIYLNSKNCIIKDEIISNGSINYAAIDIRKVIERSLGLGAASIILAHNHPSGDYKPSKEDISLTKQLFEIAKHLNILLFDHLIISSSGIYSFREHNLF